MEWNKTQGQDPSSNVAVAARIEVRQRKITTNSYNSRKESKLQNSTSIPWSPLLCDPCLCLRLNLFTSSPSSYIVLLSELKATVTFTLNSSQSTSDVISRSITQVLGLVSVPINIISATFPLSKKQMFNFHLQ